MSHLMIYLWTRLDTIKTVLELLTAASFLFMLFVVFRYLGRYSELDDELVMGRITKEELKNDRKLQKFKKPIKKSMAIFLLVLLLNFLIPSAKELLVIYAVPKIAESEVVSELSKSPKILIQRLNKYLSNEIDKTENE